MAHKHQAILDEFGYAIRHLVPTVPPEVVNEAKTLHAGLLADPEATKEQVQEALIKIGKAEFPYRRAYHELAGEVSSAHRLELILEHLDPAVKEKVKKFLDSGVSLEEFVKSHLFETELTAEERYQVEDGIMHAEDHIKEETPAKVEEKRAEYDKRVAAWKEKQAAMEAKIEELRALASKDAKWKAEILDKVETIEEGWSVTERDPDPIEIEKEIEYWKGTMAEEA
jgi:hypothetical protein